MVTDYQKHRFGSARFAHAEDMKRAGLFRSAGLHLGFYNQSPLYLEADSPVVTIGGSGSGKGRDVLMYNTCCYPSSMLVNDPKGEMAAGSISYQHKHSPPIPVDCINPFELHNLPKSSINPLDILDPKSATFHSDSQILAENFIGFSGSADGRHFDLGAQRFIDALQKFDVLMNGKTSLPNIYTLVNMIEGDPQRFEEMAALMKESGQEDIAQVAGEIIYKQQNAPKEFSGLMSTIYNAFKFMKEPAIRETLSGEDVSMRVFAGNKPHKIFIMIPAEFSRIFSAFTRCLFTAGMLYKQRAPQAPRVVYLIDEAAQLGNFPELLRSVTYGRGVGIRTWVVFQDIGQIAHNYGRETVTTFLGSAQTRQFFGVRDLETARLISEMLGHQTLEYVDPLQQHGAQRAQLQAVAAMMNGADPIYTAYDVFHHQRNRDHQRKQARALLTISGILAQTPKNLHFRFFTILSSYATPRTVSG